MSCRFNERAQAIIRMVKTAATGTTEAILQSVSTETKFVVQSATQDAASALRQSVAVAKSRLTGLRRPIRPGQSPKRNAPPR